MKSSSPQAFHDVLEKGTVRAIAAMPLLAQQIADRWVLGWRAQVKELEKEGRLLQRLADQYELERGVLERMSSPEYSHLADHEKLQLLGPPASP